MLHHAHKWLPLLSFALIAAAPLGKVILISLSSLPSICAGFSPLLAVWRRP